MRTLTIEKNDAGQRLDKFLVKYMKKAPKSFFYKMLRKKNIVLNGKKAEGSEKLSEGDSVGLFLSDETIDNFRETKETETVSWDFEVLYEDDHVLIVNKPVGVLSQRAEKADVSLVEMILSYLLDTKAVTTEMLERFKPSVCNRLDRNTSGIVVAGKSLLGLQGMSELFRERSIEKYYDCIVAGKMTQVKKVKAYLLKDEGKNVVKIIPEEKASLYTENMSRNGNQNTACECIETEYHPICSNGDYTLLEVKLITGKTHQIRAHLGFLGHPVIGDYKYGNRNINQYFKKRYGLDYQLLHAKRLVFPNMEGEFLSLSNREIIALVPEKFQTIMDEVFG